MINEFWTIGVIKKYHKRVKDNLWVLIFDDINISPKFKRLSEVNDVSIITHQYGSRYVAEIVVEVLMKEKFKGNYEFTILHYIDGRLLDYSIQTSDK